MAQGTVKSYDPITKSGWILDDGGDDVPLAPDALVGSIFVMLRQGQRVNYELAQLDGVDVATNLRIGQAGD